MRRVSAVLALVALAVVAAGCSGRDAKEASTLLAQSQAAIADVRSATFSAKISTDGAPQDFSLTMSGGAYSKGKQAGDFYVVMGSDAGYFQDIVVVQRDGKVAASVDGMVTPNAFPASPPQQSVGIITLDPYVKDVEVEHGKLIGGEATTKITGVLDTDAFLKSSLGVLPQLGGLGDAGFDVSDVFGDTRAVFYLSETTRLPVRALVDLPMEILGEEVVLHMDFAYTSFNKKLRFPSLR
jgi:hypothetical protein